MWEFYLVACELAFRRQGHMVWQAQLGHRADAVPLTRDYIAEAERTAARPVPVASPCSTAL
jgi:cyclopropane-fatty-acyl-phospholipid synthase